MQNRRDKGTINRIKKKIICQNKEQQAAIAQTLQATDREITLLKPKRRS